jgi:phosphomannomutase/phosphoglucomutase
MEISPDIFRAYDIRGIADTVLTPEVVSIIGQAVASLYPASPPVIVARDGRLSSAALSQALCTGLMAAGRSVIDIGEVPTPVLYYATHKLKTGAGIMVTGSHNPPEYNGLKLVLEGRTLHGEGIRQIHRRILQGELDRGRGCCEQRDLIDDYLDRIVADIKLGRILRLAIDCGNGVAGPIAVRLFEALGCELSTLYCDIDGRFPNHHPNPSMPQNLEDLIACVSSRSLELGLAFDGDGDRLGVIDDRGNIIWPDRQMMLYAIDLLSRHRGAKIIYDVKSSRHLSQVIKDHGGRPLMWKTGHSLLKAKLRETGALLAGEMSGHIFFTERWYGFDDGLYAGARLLEILSRDNRRCSAVFATLPDAMSTPELHIHFARDGAQHDFMRRFKHGAEFEGGEITEIDGLRIEYDTEPGDPIRGQRQPVTNIHPRYISPPTAAGRPRPGAALLNGRLSVRTRRIHKICRSALSVAHTISTRIE